MSLFAPLPDAKYDVILADNPWQFQTHVGGSVPQRAPEQHYRTHTVEELKTLPVADLAAKDCALFLWVIGSHLEQCLDLAGHWGFKYKTDAFTWVKTGKHDPNVRPISMGFWSRKQTEQCLLFTRGAPKRLDASIRQLIETDGHVIFAPKTGHSVKPDEQYDRVERLVKAESRIELFARRTRPGWHGWGDQYDPYDGL